MTNLRRELGFWEALAAVIGMLIGSGIFALPGSVFKAASTPGLGVFAWLGGGLLTIAAGLSIAELSAATPKAGGTYVFLRDAYGSWCGFLQGWMAYLAAYSGIMAALSIVFADYLSVLIPQISSFSKYVAVLAVLAVNYINYRGVGIGGMIQKIFTGAKLLPIFILMILGWLTHHSGSLLPIVPSGGNLSILSRGGLAIIGTLWAFEGWTNVASLSEEVKKPERVLPVSLLLGIAFTSVVYLGFSSSLALSLPFDVVRTSETKLTLAAAHSLLGAFGGKLVATGIVISVFGALNGFAMTSPRYYYAMARDGLFVFPSIVSKIHPSYGTPYVSIVLSTIWTIVLIVTSSFTKLIQLVVVVQWFFYSATIASVVVMRYRKPDMKRPYKTWGYPIVPILGVIGGLAVVVYSSISHTFTSIMGLIAALAGVPVYYYLSRRKRE